MFVARTTYVHVCGIHSMWACIPCLEFAYAWDVCVLFAVRYVFLRARMAPQLMGLGVSAERKVLRRQRQKERLSAARARWVGGCGVF